ncbi:MAG: sugar ABC transporter substrate-binding protein [Actinobacteria bacterium]|nr:sugar ABC transporter substrate-binding protein [Actinomycetota bacterium]
MLALAAALTVGIVACGSSSSSTTSSGEATESSETTEASEESGGGGETIPNLTFSGFEAKLPDCYEEPKKENITIGYASPTKVNEATAALARVVELEAEELGGKVIVEDANSEPDKQVTEVQRLIAQNVSAIILFPLDPKALAPVLKQAEAAGIPVLGIAANSFEAKPPAGFVSQVVESEGESGFLAAKKMAETIPQGSEVGLVNFSVPVPVIERYIEVAKEYAKKFGLNPVALQSNPSDDITGGEKAMTGLLGEVPNLAGVLAYNDESATGAHSVARSQGKEVAITGNNGGKLGYTSVESGAIIASMQLSVVDYGRCAVKGAFDLAQGKKVPIAVRGAANNVIEKATVSELPNWEEQIEEIFGRS